MEMLRLDSSLVNNRKRGALPQGKEASSSQIAVRPSGIASPPSLTIW
jgi:hypothetical protein